MHPALPLGASEAMDLCQVITLLRADDQVRMCCWLPLVGFQESADGTFLVGRMRIVRKVWKTLVAVLLLPSCVGAVRSLVHVVSAAGGATTFWLPFLCGVACWVVIFWLLPRPMWLYVFGHELTHALATWLCGGRVKRMRVTSRGGHVLVSKDNWWVTLAPYFLPIYVILVLAGYGLGHLFWGWGRHPEWLYLLLGAAYAFHLTLTCQVLSQTRQTDITSQGVLFSGVIIVLGNLIVPMVGLPLLTGVAPLGTVLAWWWQETAHVWLWLSRVF